MSEPGGAVEPSKEDASRDSNHRISPTTSASETATTASQYTVRRSIDGILDGARRSPAVLPATIGIAGLLVLAASDAGYPPTTWYGATLLALALLAVSLLTLQGAVPPPRSVIVGIVLMAGYALWSAASAIWAEQAFLAWEGAGRAVLYAAIFAQFSAWPLSAGAGRLLIAALGLGVTAIGAFQVVELGSTSQAETLFIDGRLVEPVGYGNANVALWSMGMLACLFAASARESAVALRSLSLAGAVLLGGLALMGQSRGWALAFPLAALVFVLLGPGRVRRLAAVAASGVAVLAINDPLRAVRDEFEPNRLAALIDDAISPLLVATAVAAVVGLVWGLLDRRVAVGERASRRISSAVGIATAVVVLAAGVAFVATQGNPVSTVDERWEEFKDGNGDGDPADDSKSRFASASGTNRYDFWSVAWEGFRDRPLVGAGQDNFQQLYLRKGTSGEEPRFAHSLQLGVLLQTGLVGAFLLGGVLVAALAACLALRRAEPQRRAVAGGALAVFAYWLLHGSVDWFWEFPALAGAAFAMLGLACAVVPRPDSHERPKRMRWRALGAVGLAVAAIPIAASWLSTLEVRRVASTWQERPDAVVERLKRASDLNPLSPRPALAGGAIALRLERPALAREYFAHALERDAGNTFALLDLGLLTAERGDLNGARRLLERALARAPRDPLLKEALQSVRTGRPLAAADVNSRILEAARSRGSSGGTR